MPARGPTGPQTASAPVGGALSQATQELAFSEGRIPQAPADVLLGISFFEGTKDTKPKSAAVTWETLRERLAAHDVRSAKEGPYWSPVSYANGRGRKKANVETVSLLVLDCDSGVSLEDLRPRWAGLSWLAHSTHSHTSEAPRWRVVLPFGESVPAATWERLFPVLAEAFGGGAADPACKDTSRMYLLPSCPPERESEAFVAGGEGAFLDALAILAELPEKTAPKAPQEWKFVPSSSDSHWVQAALSDELARVNGAVEGERNTRLTRAAYALGGLVPSGALDRREVEELLLSAALASGLPEEEARYCIRHNLDEGEQNPREVPEPRSNRVTVTETTAHEHPSRPGERPLTDLGLAERFRDQNAGRARYCHAKEEWLIFDGQRLLTDLSGEAERLAKATARSIWEEASRSNSAEKRAKLGEFARRSEQRRSLEAMLSLAKSEPGIAVSPRDLDSNAWALNVENGLLDLKTLTLAPHSPEHLVTKLAPVVYGPQAVAPVWERFLARILPSLEIRAFFQRWFGSCLTGIVRDDLLLVACGVGANGKTCLFETLAGVLGDYCLTARTETLIDDSRANPNAPAPDVLRLQGARLALINEFPEGQRLAENRAKQLTGGDRLAARGIHSRHTIEFEPSHKLAIRTNHRPVVRGTDLGIWRRIALVPFAVVIPEEEQLPRDQLLAQLAQERPGILGWALDGLRAWQESGIAPPREVKVATQSYREDLDLLGQFLKERTVEGHGEVSAKDLYAAFTAWCQEAGERSIPTQTSLGTKLGERGFEKRKSGAGTIVWTGLSLVSG